jgi:hypothetical protein
LSLLAKMALRTSLRSMKEKLDGMGAIMRNSGRGVAGAAPGRRGEGRRRRAVADSQAGGARGWGYLSLFAKMASRANLKSRVVTALMTKNRGIGDSASGGGVGSRRGAAGRDDGGAGVRTAERAGPAGSGGAGEEEGGEELDGGEHEGDGAGLHAGLRVATRPLAAKQGACQPRLRAN